MPPNISFFVTFSFVTMLCIGCSNTRLFTASITETCCADTLPCQFYLKIDTSAASISEPFKVTISPKGKTTEKNSISSQDKSQYIYLAPNIKYNVFIDNKKYNYFYARSGGMVTFFVTPNTK
jgi:hypothetical protein